MTEEEAFDQWCPHSRRYHEQGSYNRTDSKWNVPEATNCIGSKCMAWRWVSDPLIEFIAKKQTVVNKTSEHGFCGLAGKL